MRHMNDQLGVKKARQNEIGGMVEAYEWAVGFKEHECHPRSSGLKAYVYMYVYMCTYLHACVEDEGDRRCRCVCICICLWTCGQQCMHVESSAQVCEQIQCCSAQSRLICPQRGCALRCVQRLCPGPRPSSVPVSFVPLLCTGAGWPGQLPNKTPLKDCVGATWGVWQMVPVTSVIGGHGV